MTESRASISLRAAAKPAAPAPMTTTSIRVWRLGMTRGGGRTYADSSVAYTRDSIYKDVIGAKNVIGRTGPPSRLLFSIDYAFRNSGLLTSAPDKMDGSVAQSIYRAEKARAMQERRISHAQLMAEAKEAFNKMLADAQLARKGGRPRTNPVTVNTAASAASASPKATPAVSAAKPARHAPTAKAAPSKKAAPAKKARVAPKRSSPARAKPTKAAAKRRVKVTKKSSSTARASRPAGRSKASSKRR